jgi:hypothetical protein
MSKSSKIISLLTAGAALALGTGAAQCRDDGDHDGNRLPLYLTRTLDAAAQDPTSPGNLWVGSGIPATNFLVQENLDKGIELGIKGQIRQGGDILPTFVDADGSVHVVVPSGPQPGNPTRAAWNFTFSVNTALPGANPSLDDYDATLLIDLDPSDKTNYLELKLAKLGPPAAAPDQHNGYGWKAGNTVAISDDEGTSRVTQNSQNLAFYASLIDTNKAQPGVQPYTFGPGQFDVDLSIRAKADRGHGHDDGDDHDDRRELARVHVIFDVVDNP